MEFNGKAIVESKVVIYHEGLSGAKSCISQ